MMGMHGESWVNNAIQPADLLLALGMRFDDRVTGNLASYAPNAKKIHVDIDPCEINKNVKVDIALIGDLKQILQTLTPLLSPTAAKRTLTGNRPSLLSSRSEAERSASPTTEPHRTSPWLHEINRSKGTASVRDIINLPDNGHLYAAHVINDIWREAIAAGREKETIIVTDVGQHQMWEAQYFKHETPRSLITSGGLGTMGFALPAAIGAKVACPEKDVWVIAGDGGFQMTAAELSTIVQETLAINIAVINNGFLGMVRQWQETFYDKNYSACPILSPRLRPPRRRPRHRRRPRLRTQTSNPHSHKIPHLRQPFLINFQVEKEDGVYPMIAPGAALHEMVRRPHQDPLLETAEDDVRWLLDQTSLKCRIACCSGRSHCRCRTRYIEQHPLSRLYRIRLATRSTSCRLDLATRHPLRLRYRVHPDLGFTRPLALFNSALSRNPIQTQPPDPRAKGAQHKSLGQRPRSTIPNDRPGLKALHISAEGNALRPTARTT